MPTASLNNRMRNKNRMAGISQQSLAGRYLGLDQKEEGEEKEKKKEEYRPSLEETASDTGGSVPTRLSRLKNEAKSKQEKEKKEKKEEKAPQSGNILTSNLLKRSWQLLIPSWGLSLIWINTHVLLRFSFGEKLFCKLGHEWIPRQAKKITAGSETVETASKAIGLGEIALLLLLDSLLAIILFAVVAVIFMLFDIIWGLFGWIVEIVEVTNKGALKVLDITK